MFRFVFVYMCIVSVSLFSFAEEHANERSVDELVQILKTGGYHSVWNAVEAIKDRGTEAQEAMRALEALREESEFQELNMMIDIAMKRIDPKAIEEAPSLMETAKNAEKLDERIRAAQEIAKIGPRVEGAKELFLDWINTGDSQQLEMTGYTMLGMMEVGAEELLPNFLDTLTKSEDIQERAQAALQVGMLGPQSAAVVPELLEMAKTGHPQERGYAMLALGYIHAQPEKVIPILDEALEDQTLQRAAAIAITSYEPKELDLEKLSRYLSNSSLQLQRYMIRGYGHFGEHARPYLETIEKLETSPDRSIQHFAAEAVKKIRFRMNGE